MEEHYKIKEMQLAGCQIGVYVRVRMHPPEQGNTVVYDGEIRFFTSKIPDDLCGRHMVLGERLSSIWGAQGWDDGQPYQYKYSLGHPTLSAARQAVLAELDGLAAHYEERLQVWRQALAAVEAELMSHEDRNADAREESMT